MDREIAHVAENAQAAILDDVLARIERKIKANKRRKSAVAVLEELRKEVVRIHPRMWPEGTKIAF